jgi:hypothetical protein
MLQPVFDFIEKFATDFSWKRLIIVFSLVFIIGFVYFLFETQLHIVNYLNMKNPSA